MTQATAVPGSVTAPAASLPARILGVLFSPRATYAGVAARPRWVGALGFVLVFGAVATFVFLSTDVGKQAMLDQQVRTMESFGVKIPDAAYERMEQRVDQARYTGAIFQAVFFTLAGLIISGLSIGVFNAILGGDASFKQVFSIVAHSGVIFSVSQLFGLPLAYVQHSMAGATNLAVFAPFLDENSFAARALGAVDL